MVPITKQEHHDIIKRISRKHEMPMTGRNKNGPRKKYFVLEGDDFVMGILAEIRGMSISEIKKQNQ